MAWMGAAGVWPTPENSWGHFTITFPAWMAIVLLVGGMLVHLLEVEQRQTAPPISPRTADARTWARQP
ncbi:hypothetical protein [uncultured Serinicoccus sp.]|uniref:hypothetical protein n=2 Tax=uncultured Serinicoccus sp. TaxID=735514 RepID=UPI00260D2DCF|nr:hypothetical protein [uncultured Serinicoccus sp.]